MKDYCQTEDQTRLAKPWYLKLKRAKTAVQSVKFDVMVWCFAEPISDRRLTRYAKLQRDLKTKCLS